MRYTVLVIALLVASTTGCGIGCGIGCALTPPVKDWRIKVYEDGKRAYRLDIPANGNPYIGLRTNHSELWLDGYMDAKESK